jgi:hypothetical protein
MRNLDLSLIAFSWEEQEPLVTISSLAQDWTHFAGEICAKLSSIS